jgi:hypothetical protein
MQDRIFGDREKALEESYFREQDAHLLGKLRQKANLDEIAIALRDKLQLDNPDLLLRVRELGITAETAPAFLLAPLVQVAWAEGKVGKQEQSLVLRLAQRRGVEEDSPAYHQLAEWLRVRPPDNFFDTALEAMKVGFAVLPAGERAERIKEVVHACQEVAEASGGLGRLMGLGDGVSRTEASMLDQITQTLRGSD